MRTFRVALTGDFLDENGASAYGDTRLDLFKGKEYLEYRFILDHAPRRGDASYWDRLYSMEVTPDQLAGVNGLVVLRPHVRYPATRCR